MGGTSLSSFFLREMPRFLTKDSKHRRSSALWFGKEAKDERTSSEDAPSSIAFRNGSETFNTHAHTRARREQLPWALTLPVREEAFVNIRSTEGEGEGGDRFFSPFPFSFGSSGIR